MDVLVQKIVTSCNVLLAFVKGYMVGMHFMQLSLCLC
jgi:hypothetical protein